MQKSWSMVVKPKQSFSPLIISHSQVLEEGHDSNMKNQVSWSQFYLIVLSLCFSLDLMLHLVVHLEDEGFPISELLYFFPEK
jgi:hypothetical protein